MSRTRVLAVLVLAAVVAVSAYSLPLAEWTTQLAERARGTGAWGVALFFTAYVISTVAFLPGSVLTLAAVAAAVIGARAAKRALDAQLQEPTSL